MDQKVENLPPISTRDRRKNGMIIANNVEGREGNLEWGEEKEGGPRKNLMEGKKRIGTRR